MSVHIGVEHHEICRRVRVRSRAPELQESLGGDLRRQEAPCYSVRETHDLRPSQQAVHHVLVRRRAAAPALHSISGQSSVRLAAEPGPAAGRVGPIQLHAFESRLKKGADGGRRARGEEA